MSNARDIIIRPIITEKTMKLMDTDNKITFAVAKGANKTQVRLAVEEIFGVKVEQVNILNCKPKTKRMGKAELTILRLALYEILYDEEVPEKVAINEAVELAKRFGGNESPAFINGVLAKLV